MNDQDTSVLVSPVPIIHSRFVRPNTEGFVCSTPTMTVQDEAVKASCDVNNIVRRHAETGLWGDTFAPSERYPSFGDFSQVPDFHSAQLILAHSNEEFMSLPSGIRKRFNNDVSQLLSFLDDESNFDEAVKLGLIEPKKVVEPVVTPVEVKPVESGSTVTS